MLRSGRFRHRLLDDAFLKDQSSYCYNSLEVFLQLWREESLTDVEMAAVYILVFLFYRRPNDFLGGVHNETLANRSTDIQYVTAAQIINIFRATLPEHLRNLKSLNRLEQKVSFVELFCSLSWRSVPLSAAKSLSAWKAGSYDLKLIVTVPSPEEVLMMQACGQRCVSMLIKPQEISSFVDEGRDVLGFIVHDLIHADHFFSDSEKARSQILFCKKLQLVLQIPEIQQMIFDDAVFKSEFNYLMSDMNSVPLHLLKTFKAILLGYFKRQNGVAMTESLPLDEESKFHTLFKAALRPWQFSKEALDSAFRLNTPQYNGPADSELLHFALMNSSV
ncbi:MAG: hypothetical protein ACXVCP_08305 [Bdellovibrio sp.]